MLRVNHLGLVLLVFALACPVGSSGTDDAGAGDSATASDSPATSVDTTAYGFCTAYITTLCKYTVACCTQMEIDDSYEGNSEADLADDINVCEGKAGLFDNGIDGCMSRFFPSGGPYDPSGGSYDSGPAYAFPFAQIYACFDKIDQAKGSCSLGVDPEYYIWQPCLGYAPELPTEVCPQGEQYGRNSHVCHHACTGK